MKLKMEPTTLGDLVVTVTEAVEEATGKSTETKTNMLVSQIVNSLISQGKIRLRKASSLSL